MIALIATSDPNYHANGREYFTHDDNMIDRGSILSGHAVLGTDHEAVGPFIALSITDRALIWEKVVAIFQGSDAWTYLKPSKTHSDIRVGYKLI